MRTSAPAAESGLTVIVLLVTLAVLILLAGGPSQFMLMVQNGVQWFIDLALTTYKNVRT